MRFLRPSGFFLLVLGLATGLRAQSTTPAVKQAIPAQALTLVAGATALDLKGYIELPGVTGQLVQFDTVFGKFNVELLADAAPKHVDNFLRYVNAGSYINSFFHRTDTLDGTSANSIVQGGGYTSTGGTNVATISKFAPVALEYRLPNARGTLAAARTSDVNSATSEWYINTRDNSTILAQNNGGGYTVFGRVLGTGMTVPDAIAALPHPNPAPSDARFASIPVRNYTNGTNIDASNLALVTSVVRADVYPGGSGTPVLTFAVQSSATNVVRATLSAATLTLTPLAVGSATIVVTATDTNNNAINTAFAVTVTAGTSAPAIAAQPQPSVTLASGTTGTVVFAVNATGAPTPTYQWRKDGADISGATAATLVLNNAGAAQAGTYTCVVKNDVGSITSQAGVLAFATAPAAGRLVNLSILTTASSGAKALTMGATVGGTGTTGAMPLVIRAVGPTLGTAFNLTGVLADPLMTLNAAGNSTALAMNDDWGGGATLAAAFTNVGAFALPANSLDSAIVPAVPGLLAGGYTVQVTGKGSASGLVIAEIYDAAGTARTATTPRLTNLSTLTQIDAGSTLAVGFVIGGNTARTLLVRGVGPTLGGAPFNIGGTMIDPKLELFNNATGQKILENNDWGGDASLAAVSSSVGAFALASAATKDAVLVVTLPPGQYSARVNGADGGGGTAIVEVYEVP